MVEQEYADLYPLTSDILSKYLPGLDCRDCGLLSCMACAEALLEGMTEPVQCPELKPGTASLIDGLLSFDIPLLPYNVMMERISPELVSIGHPNSNSPVMLTCNSCETGPECRADVDVTGLNIGRIIKELT